MARAKAEVAALIGAGGVSPGRLPCPTSLLVAPATRSAVAAQALLEPKGARMKIWLLSGLDPAGEHLARSIAASCPLDRIVRVVWPPPSRRRAGSARRRISAMDAVSAVLRRGEQAWREHHTERLGRGAASHLAAHDASLSMAAVAADTTVAAPLINGPELAGELARCRPDLLVVHGAPVLHERVFGVPSSGTINVHYGIAPEYRGTSTLFWALYRRDFEHVGVTVHRVTSDLDGGPVLGHALPKLRPDDDEAAVFAACARVGADLVLAYLERCRRGAAPAGVALPLGPPPHRKAERRIAHDVAYWWRRNVARERLPARAAKVTLYGAVEAPPDAASR